MCYPVIDYTIGAWNTGANCKKLDQIQERAMRYFGGLPRNCPISAMVGDFGWTPGIVRRELEQLRFYNQIMKMPQNRLTRMVFDREKEHMFPNSWCSNVKDLCYKISMGTCYETNTPVDLKLAKEKLLNLFEAKWKNDVESKSKLSNYSKIKRKICAEGYLKINISKVCRSLIGQLRSGSMKLEIETGRYSSIERANRICQVCNKEVEDELHFLFRCEDYVESRSEMYHECPEVLNYITDIERLDCLNKRPNVLGKYIEKLWRTRNSILNNKPRSSVK